MMFLGVVVVLLLFLVIVRLGIVLIGVKVGLLVVGVLGLLDVKLGSLLELIVVWLVI